MAPPCARSRSTARPRPGRASTAPGWSSTGLAAENELRVVADCAYSRTGEGLHRFVDPVDKEVYLYSQFETADAQRVFACFDQPDLKATFTLTVTAPAHWKVVSNAPVDVGRAAARAERQHGRPASRDVPGHAGDDHLHHRAVRRAVPRGARRRTTASTWASSAAHSLRRVPRRRRPLPDHQAGLRLLPRAVRRAATRSASTTSCSCPSSTPARWRTSAASRPRRGLHLPLAGHRRRVRAARQDDPARAGAHVVRRPRHHALVGRPVAERVVRRVGLALCQHRGHPLHRRLDDVLRTSRSVGLPAGPALLHPPGRCEMPDMRGGRGQLRRHHVRQGRLACSSSSSRTSALDDVRRRPARLLRASTPGATPTFDDLLSALEAASGRELSRVRRAVAGDRPGQHAAPGGRDRRRRDGSRAVAVLQEAPGRHYPTLRTHRIGVGLYDLAGRRRWSARRGSSSTSTGARTEVAELVGVAPPDVLLLNDDDLTYAKLRLDERSMAHRGRAHRRPDRLAAPGAVLGRRLGHDPRRRAGRPRLRRRWCCSGLPAGDRHQPGHRRAAPGSQLRRRPSTPTRPGRRPAGRCWPTAPRPRWPRPSRAATSSSPGPARSPRPPARRATSRVLRGLLDGTDVPAGLTVDTDLRWTLLTRSSPPARATTRPIDAELTRDHTATGERQAATARAARPDRGGQGGGLGGGRRDRRAAQRAAGGDDRRLRAGRASASCCARTSSATSTRRRRCGPRGPPRWRRRSSSGLYPMHVVEPATVDATDAYLARTRRAPGAAPAGGRGPRRIGAGAARPGPRRRRGLAFAPTVGQGWSRRRQHGAGAARGRTARRCPAPPHRPGPHRGSSSTWSARRARTTDRRARAVPRSR